MEETESQIAKILLGNTKASSTYVYTMAEKADFGQSELYVVTELPLFNPAGRSLWKNLLGNFFHLKKSLQKTD